MGKRAQGVFGLCLIGVTVYGCVEGASNRPLYPLPHPDRLSISQTMSPLITDAIDRVRKDCPRLDVMLPDVSTVIYRWSTEGPGGDYRARAYRWSIQLELAFVLAEDRPLPLGMSGQEFTPGDYVFFDLGSGDNPGVEVNKPSSRYACNLPTDSSHNILIRDPWMVAIEASAPAEVIERRPAPTSSRDLNTLRKLSNDPPILYAPVTR